MHDETNYLRHEYIAYQAYCEKSIDRFTYSHSREACQLRRGFRMVMGYTKSRVGRGMGINDRIGVSSEFLLLLAMWKECSWSRSRPRDCIRNREEKNR